MKNFLLVIIMISMISQSFSQEIGVRGGTLFSNKNTNYAAFGYGVFYKINKPTSKISFIIFADRFEGKNFYNKSSPYNSQRLITNFKSVSGGVSILGTIINNQFLAVRFGPSFTLDNVKMDGKTEVNPTFNYTEKYYQADLGIGALATLEYKNFLYKNLNLIAFINPSYYQLLTKYSSSRPRNGWNEPNNFGLNTQLGISYKLP